ncbi:ABC transporter substrate-binding protein [Aldersonia kunmingensis]|uniref:ABC transporter substrate-binding protein n=1 Tax=Aldersonia kunmingensis TaxID=408066 RepID=UPI00082B2882|nr:ABC transporter substrate-binding protein [Aldersonia kunmingensis]
MSYESAAQPIKVGYLMDFVLSDDYPQERRDDLTIPFDMVFADALERGLIDRPIEVIYREVEGLPKGSVKAVIDAYEELVEEGCLVIFGPHIGDNAVAIREVLGEKFKVPALSVTGSDEALSEWFFALPMGSHFDEPIFWADLLVKGGHNDVGVLMEKSLVGEAYIANFRKACAERGIRITAEITIAQTAQDTSEAVRALHDAKAGAIVHCGFGFGIVFVNPVLAELDWDPPRFAGTAFQNAWINPVMWNAFMGWTGVDQYDEHNPVGQQFLDEFATVTGRRPEWCVPVVNRDVAVTILRALANAHPLSPRGVKEALERVKMVPAASGAPGTRISFGNWTRRGWMGPGYLVARQLNSDGWTSHLIDRFGE